MATDKYPKQTTVRLTEGEHRALTGEAERRGMSLSRYLATAGLQVLAGESVAHQVAGRGEEERQAEQARREAKELEELHRQMKRVGHGLWSLLEEVRSGGDGAPSSRALEAAAQRIDQATGEVLKRLS